MKSKVKVKIGKWLMNLQPVNITIIDDQGAYFNRGMISKANKVGFKNIKRLDYITPEVFDNLLDNPPNIIILDIKGVVDPSIAKDGLEVASIMHKQTNSFVVVTSAHQFHLKNRIADTDYIIENRTLTAVDFIEELDIMVTKCIDLKFKLFKKIIFKVGFKLIKSSLSAN